jgi:hypothetical protein
VTEGRLPGIPRTHCRASHEVKVAHAATAGEYAAGCGRPTLNRRGDAASADFGKARLNVCPGEASRTLLFQPFEIEVFEARALRGRPVEPGIGESVIHEGRVHSAARGPGASFVERHAKGSSRPGIEQRVTRAGVEARDIAGSGKDRYVGDASDV